MSINITLDDLIDSALHERLKKLESTYSTLQEKISSKENEIEEIEKSIEDLAKESLNKDCKEIIELLSKKFGERNVTSDVESFGTKAWMEINISSEEADGNLVISAPTFSDNPIHKGLEIVEDQLGQLRALKIKMDSLSNRLDDEKAKIKRTMIDKLVTSHIKSDVDDAVDSIASEVSKSISEVEE